MDVFFKVPPDSAEDDELADAIAQSGNVALFECVDRIKFKGGEVVQTRSPIEPFRDAALATAAFPLPEGTAVRFLDLLRRRVGKVPTLPAVALQIHALPYLDRFLSLLGHVGAATSRTCQAASLRAETAAVDARAPSRARSHPDAARRALKLLERGTSRG